MTGPIHRRRFLGTTAATLAAGTLASTPTRARGANETIRLGVMGTGGRGTALAQAFQKLDGAEVIAVCDVDRRRVETAAEAVAGAGGKTPKKVIDFREILDDPDVDALVVATCNHWHAPAAILACQAGKHVYVEKPCSHTPREGELLVEAARANNRHVQMGNQRRSWPKLIEGMTRIHEGAIGRPYYARCEYANMRPSIGKGTEGPAPEWLDYDLWQGPAPRRPFRDNILHYNWHWFWHWGNGEIGNNGVHYLDIARWALGVGLPSRVNSSGGRLHLDDDDQETPDTHVVTFDFPNNTTVTFESLSRNAYRPQGPGSEMTFYGTEGALAISGGGYALFDLKGKETERVSGSGGDDIHLINFLDTIRGEASLNSEIAEGHQSALLCHLGNIAHRVGRSLHCDPSTGKILDDPEAMSHWTREYAPGWEPKA